MVLSAAYSAAGDDDGPTDPVTGRVTCDSGAPVVGVYVEAGSQAHSGFASFRADENDPSAATYAWSLPPGRRHSVHVGCGGTRAAWSTNNRSPDVDGSDNTFICRDSDAAARRSHYGRCESD